MMDFVIAAVVILVIAAALVYIVKEKRKGIRCIGCPDAPKCASGGGCSGYSGCEH